MKLLSGLLAASVVLAASVINSPAQFVTNTYNTSTPISSTKTDWGITDNDNIDSTGNDNGLNSVVNLTFPQFNGPGTLDDVILNLTSSFTSVMGITNGGGLATTFKIQTSVDVYVDDAGDNFSASPYISEISPKYTYTLLLPGFSADNGPSGYTGGGNSGNIIFTASQVLTEFTGAGNINIPASTFTSTSVSGANPSDGQYTVADLTGTVSYVSSAIPEPSTIGLLALGFLAAPFFKRQRQ